MSPPTTQSQVLSAPGQVNFLADQASGSDATELITAVHVGLVAGEIQLSSGPDLPSGHVNVQALHGRPIEVSLLDGILTVRHLHVRWDGLRDTMEGLKDAVLGVAKRDDRADVHIYLPSTAAVRVSTVAANTQCRGIAGALSARTVTGCVHVELPPGSQRQVLRSVSGDLTVALPTGVGYRLNARSVSGAIEVDGRDVSGRPGPPQGEVRSGDASVRIAATSVSGNIRLTRH